MYGAKLYTEAVECKRKLGLVGEHDAREKHDCKDVWTKHQGECRNK